MKHSFRYGESGFTLLELMVAMTLLVIVFSIAFQAFSETIRGWRRGTEVMESIKHGEYSISQLANALNSAVFFFDVDKKRYGFTLEHETGGTFGLPADRISWVTASSAFMPHNSPFRFGPHRITLYIDQTDDGEFALFASARPTVAEEDEYEEEPILVSRGIQGIECMIYNADNEDWEGDWEKENSIPERIMVSLYSESDEKDEEPVVFTRVLEIPVALSVKDRLTRPTVYNSPAASSGGSTSTGSISIRQGSKP